jgi:hypothetical protein
MIILVDHNLEGYVVLLQGTLASEGWLDLLSIRFLFMEEAGLATDSNDRVVWRYAQLNQMILLTANRRMIGEDSLEQTIREENTPTSLPVVTIGTVGRLSNREYRERCAARLAEIIMYPENSIGVGRIFIP